MTRRVRARPAFAAAALALAAALAGCAQSSDMTSAGGAGSAPTTTAPATTPTTTSPTTTSSTTPGAASGSLTVSPTTASPHSTIRFAFIAPAGVAAPGRDDVSAGLSVIGPQKPGCVGLHREPLTSLPPGQHTSVSLGPAQLGGDWCPGTYSARVEVLARPKCGPGMMCPQFIRVVAMLGPATFKISG
ncbi:MAG TPA: hypothetical protein VIY10_17630 [Solirubrobacteraceae bacterium]